MAVSSFQRVPSSRTCRSIIFLKSTLSSPPANGGFEESLDDNDYMPSEEDDDEADSDGDNDPWDDLDDELDDEEAFDHGLPPSEDPPPDPPSQTPAVSPDASREEVPWWCIVLILFTVAGFSPAFTRLRRTLRRIKVYTGSLFLHMVTQDPICRARTRRSRLWQMLISLLDGGL